MAPNFRAGKGAVLLFNNADLSQILTGVTVEASVNALDTTVLQNNDKTYIAGLRDGTVSYEGLYDGTALSTASTASTGALDARFQSALAASTQPIVTYGPEDDSSIGNRVRMFRQEQTAYTASSPVDDVVKVSAAGQISGRHDSGVWLHPLAARLTTSSTFASFDSAVDAGTTGGGVGHLHVTASSTLTSVVVKIQHSTAVSESTAGWTDLITFSSFDETTGATAVQRTTASGTVGRRTRAIISTYTGGAAKTATLAVAFARRGENV